MHGIFRRVVVIVCTVLGSASAIAAEYEMGIGIPQFGSYSSVTGIQAIVWRLDDASFPFPAGCSTITLSPATMGMDAYKIAVATMLLAKASGRRVRFYAHGPREGGCGIDYVELQ